MLEELKGKRRSRSNLGRRERDLTLLSFSSQLCHVQRLAQGSGDGYSNIDNLGAWECGLCTFRTLEEVPYAHREKFFSSILQKLQAANTELEETRSLKWLLIAPQLLLREGKRGGRRGQGNSALSTRFEMATEGNYGGLLEDLKRDKEAQPERGRQGDGEK